jgi:hypothetical protein
MKTQTAYDAAAFAEGDRRHVLLNGLVPPDPLDRPPVSLMQVLCWLDQLIEPGETYPTNTRFKEGQALPKSTSLRDVLVFLGADPTRTPNAEMEE